MIQSETNCPNCGALIGTGQPGLPVVTCGFCNSLLTKAGDELTKVGEAGRVPFDVSPLQIGTRLTVDGKRGEIVGRERWAFDRGFWNEWLLQFPNGETRWVAEEAGLYMVMEETQLEPGEVSQVGELTKGFQPQIGKTVRIANSSYTVADVKRIRCVAVEGSLPHTMTSDTMRRSIDLRTRDKQVLTMQSDSTGDSVWSGAYYRLEDMDPAGLRTFEHWSQPSFEAAG